VLGPPGEESVVLEGRLGLELDGSFNDGVVLGTEGPAGEDSVGLEGRLGLELDGSFNDGVVLGTVNELGETSDEGNDLGRVKGGGLNVGALGRVDGGAPVGNLGCSAMFPCTNLSLG